jgi:hypothetical protein
MFDFQPCDLNKSFDNVWCTIGESYILAIKHDW